MQIGDGSAANEARDRISSFHRKTVDDDNNAGAVTVAIPIARGKDASGDEGGVVVIRVHPDSLVSDGLQTRRMG